MAYKLKNGQETFQVVDGPDTGKTYKRDVEYESIPPGEEHRFEKVKVSTPKTEAIPANDQKKAKEKK
ncbi:MAG: hypothetical protein KKF12_17635 [Proteobacteria bacterium]|nr:hypothetical protein [Pseudomonadota bacterium]MBU4132642.1 hypothetical protein [Pseudomonadota bacterium]